MPPAPADVTGPAPERRRSVLFVLLFAALIVALFLWQQLGSLGRSPESARLPEREAVEAPVGPGPGDVLSRESRVADAMERASSTIAAITAVERAGGDGDAVVVALIEEALREPHAAVAIVYLDVAAEYRPGSATIARLREALAVAARGGASWQSARVAVAPEDLSLHRRPDTLPVDGPFGKDAEGGEGRELDEIGDGVPASFEPGPEPTPIPVPTDASSVK